MAVGRENRGAILTRYHPNMQHGMMYLLILYRSIFLKVSPFSMSLNEMAPPGDVEMFQTINEDVEFSFPRCADVMTHQLLQFKRPRTSTASLTRTLNLV